jgi:hypothetical protein
MMQELEEGKLAFSSFRVLRGNADGMERSELFRNMGQLFSHVSGRCSDEQVAQYDNVLCQLAELVEVEARAFVAAILAPLERAPGTAVVRLANDDIEVARPLLQFSTVLSDDDLIEIVNNKSEDHRVAIAGRRDVTERVGEAIVDQGEQASVVQLVRNDSAKLAGFTLEKLIQRAAQDDEIAHDLRERRDIDWIAIRDEVSEAGRKVLETLSLVESKPAPDTMGTVSAVVFNRIRNRAGFSAPEWKVAWYQVKALNDRQQLDQRALARFARFGYGHHTAAALAVMLSVPPNVFVKWLATQDYNAVTVACKAVGVVPDMFRSSFEILPWRDMPTKEDLDANVERFIGMSRDEAEGIFELWQGHGSGQRAEDRKISAA